MKDWRQGIAVVASLWLLPAATVAQSGALPPYQCGIVLNSKEAILKAYRYELEVLQLKPGEVVADIGGSNGYRMAMFSVLYDSLVLYVEDIDTQCLNEREFAAVRAFYEKLNQGPLSSKFHLVVGTETATLLPPATFHKILVTASYHHFSHPQAMMADVRTKLEPTGKIYVIENVVRKEGRRRKRLCNDPLHTEALLIHDFEDQGFKVEAVHPLGRWWTKMFVLSPR